MNSQIIKNQVILIKLYLMIINKKFYFLEDKTLKFKKLFRSYNNFSCRPNNIIIS